MLCREGDAVVAVNIPPCEVIVIDVPDHHQVPRVCYEIGNKHAALFYGEGPSPVYYSYNEPMLVMLQKLGVQTEVKRKSWILTAAFRLRLTPYPLTKNGPEAKPMPEKTFYYGLRGRKKEFA